MRTNYRVCLHGYDEDIVEFLEPTKTQEKAIHKNKNRWKISKWWQDFLDGAGKVELGEAERDLDLGGLLRWLRVSVVPALKLLEELGNEKILISIKSLRILRQLIILKTETSV